MSDKIPKTGKEFIRLARKSDKVANVREGKGSHVVVEFVDGSSISAPVHSHQQLDKGILHKIIKAFKAAGVIGGILLALWVVMTWLTL